MNFWLRTPQTTSFSQPPISDIGTDSLQLLKPAATSKLGQHIAEDLRPCNSIKGNGNAEIEEVSREEENMTCASAKNDSIAHDNFTDVSEEEGWITIPHKCLGDWFPPLNISSLNSIDRSFVFPGEQVHLVTCLSASKHDSGIITPFKVAAVIQKNSQGPCVGDEDTEQGFETSSETESDTHKGTSLLQMEDHKRHTENLLHRFNNSHFFVRISESMEPLWSKRTTAAADEIDVQDIMSTGTKSDSKVRTTLNAIVDRCNFDSCRFGGLARMVKCFSLSNGDIMVILQVNVGIGFLKDPMIEIIQFERCTETKSSPITSESLAASSSDDPCGELLNWLLPLENTTPLPAPPLALPIGSNSGAIISSQRSNSSASSSSQIFSFGHFRSYSMSSFPQSAPAPYSNAAMANTKPNFDIENWDRFPSQPFLKAHTGNNGLMSFRGIPLEPERFSVSCGLAGIYLPGRRWRKKIEIIEPVEVNCFSSDCNTNDLLCVQIKNVSPEHIPDLVLFIDAITIVYENTARGGPPNSLPVACVDAGEGYCFPNLALSSGEEHSFIIKPATSIWKNGKAPAGSSSQSLHQNPPKIIAHDRPSSDDQYSVLVSYRSNFTESRLLVKKPTNWKPRGSRDLMISVTSEMSTEPRGGGEGDSQLSVQVLTLQASNLTPEDMTLTILAPSLFAAPSLVPLGASPTAPIRPFSGLDPTLSNPGTQNPEGDSIDGSSTGPVFPNHCPSCTHLWLRSRVPLGCISSRSTTKVKLELLPLTDGVITLDTLQIDVKEKGLMYVPEHPLKIHATSTISRVV